MAKATVPPTALVSEVIALAVAVPVTAGANAVAEKGRVAMAVPGAATVPPVGLKTSLPDWHRSAR